MTNIAAISTNQHGGANDEKLKLETLVRSVGAKLQAIIHIINCLGNKKDWKSIKKGWKVEKLENDNRFSWNTYFEKITRLQWKITRSLDEPKNH